MGTQPPVGVAEPLVGQEPPLKPMSVSLISIIFVGSVWHSEGGMRNDAEIGAVHPVTSPCQKSACTLHDPPDGVLQPQLEVQPRESFTSWLP